MLNTDVIYQIMRYSTIDTILSICLTSKFNFNDKLFWLNQFKRFCLPKVQYKLIYKYNNNFTYISYYKLFLNLDPYDTYIKSLKVIKNGTGQLLINLKRTNKEVLRFILYRVFGIHNISVKNLTSIRFYYNGYVWIFFYTYSSDVNYFNADDLEYKILLFLYKLFKYKVYFKMTQS